MRNAIILFSGGLDSTTCLAFAKSKDFHCHALSFYYHQKHCAELNAAKRIAKHFDVQHIIVDLPAAQFNGSALTNPDLQIPIYSGKQEIPATYVAARNTIFLAYALSWAEMLSANDIFIGVSAVDYSGYPDCRPEYIQAFQTLANLATKAAVEGAKITLHAPLIHLSKNETIQLGMQLGVDYQMTVSCYAANTNGEACGQCDSCTLRMKGFKEANLPDLTRYQYASHST